MDIEHHKKIASSPREISSIPNKITYTLGNKYILTSKIAKGGTSKIFLGFPKSSFYKTYAFKILENNPSNFILFNNEVNSLSKLNHPNIIKKYDSGASTLFKPSGKKKEVYFIIIDYIPNGPLFDYIYKTQLGFGENHAKIIMHSWINAIEHIHNNNYVHRDLKTENIMVDEFYNIKITDFGFAGEKCLGNGLFHDYTGTLSYASPELWKNKKYYGVSNDIFSWGVIMFILVTGKMPFKLAWETDGNYLNICKCDYESFWKTRNHNLTTEFKELFCNMVAYDYTQRPSWDEIKLSNWMKTINYNDWFELKGVLKQRQTAFINKRESSDLSGKINVNDACDTSIKHCVNRRKHLRFINYQNNHSNINNEKVQSILDSAHHAKTPCFVVTKINK